MAGACFEQLSQNVANLFLFCRSTIDINTTFGCIWLSESWKKWKSFPLHMFRASWINTQSTKKKIRYSKFSIFIICIQIFIAFRVFHSLEFFVSVIFFISNLLHISTATLTALGSLILCSGTKLYQLSSVMAFSVASDKEDMHIVLFHC